MSPKGNNLPEISLHLGADIIRVIDKGGRKKNSLHAVKLRKKA
jgi:hypothetical protein